MSNGFDTELNFHSRQLHYSESYERGVFLDLAERSLGLYLPVALALQPLFACKKFSRSSFLIIKCMVDLYLLSIGRALIYGTCPPRDILGCGSLCKYWLTVGNRLQYSSYSGR